MSPQDASTDTILDALKGWVASDPDLAPAYVFGSLVYRSGQQFVAESDVDLVIVLPDTLTDAESRERWLVSLVDRKKDLEVRLIQLLGRPQANVPIASIIPVTRIEISNDIHKDGHRLFFKSNTFMDLKDGTRLQGLPDAGQIAPNRLLVGALGYVQKTRNRFLRICTNGTRPFQAYAGTEPLPKGLMRAAAIANSCSSRTAPLSGQEYDLLEGLETLSNELHQRRDIPRFRQLRENVAARRGGRGSPKPVSSEDLLLLAELVFDIAHAGTSLPGKPKSEDACVSINTTTGNDEVELPRQSPETTKDESSLQSADNVTVVASILPPVETSNEGSSRRGRLPYTSSCSLFHIRFGSAFPGVREVRWYDDPDEIGVRLLKLLEQPLSFEDFSDPIWWWRGPRNLFIHDFQRTSDGNFLMGGEELKISKVAALPGTSYTHDMVYVHVEPLPRTGLYQQSESYSTFQTEEYGLVDGKLLVTREEYDDGNVFREGALQSISGRSELRVRYVSSYNFLIGPKQSPVNSSRIDRELKIHLDEALRDPESAIVRLHEWLSNLPSRLPWHM